MCVCVCVYVCMCVRACVCVCVCVYVDLHSWLNVKLTLCIIFWKWRFTGSLHRRFCQYLPFGLAEANTCCSKSLGMTLIHCWKSCFISEMLADVSTVAWPSGNLTGKNVLQQDTASCLALKPPLKTSSELWPVRWNESMQKWRPWWWREVEKIVFERLCLRLIFCWVYNMCL
jgi:hypothetical protein